MDFQKLDKSQVKHFLVLSAIAVVCVYSLNLGHFSVRDLGFWNLGWENPLQALMAAYLYIIATPGFLVAGICASVSGVNYYMPEYVLSGEFIMWGVNIVFVWFIAGYFAKVKTKNRIIDWMYKAVPYVVGLLALFIAWCRVTPPF